MKTKICTKCGIEKPINEFPIGCKRGNKAYHKSYCKVCDGKRSRAYYQEHKEQCRKKHYEYYKENREVLLARDKKDYYSNPLRKLKKSLSKIRKSTGLTINELVDYYNTQFEKQQGQCAICGVHISKLSTRFHIDHNHKTGELRQLLCSNCNSGIGNLRDSSELCQRAFQYLQSFEC